MATITAKRLAAGLAALALAAFVLALCAPANAAEQENIVNKNLFSKDRKPPAPPPPPKGPPPVGLQELKQVKLLAIYALGESRKALVLAPNSVLDNKKVAKGVREVWIKLGDVLAGFTVTEITPLSVLFKLDEDEFELRVRPEKTDLIKEPVPWNAE